jgi:uncharacterized protein (DUF736 family)
MISASTSAATAANNNNNNIHNPAYPLLSYQVVDCSSFSSGYRPENVLEDRPADQASRWSSATNDQHQYITLKLDSPALLSSLQAKLSRRH